MPPECGTQSTSSSGEFVQLHKFVSKSHEESRGKSAEAAVGVATVGAKKEKNACMKNVVTVAKIFTFNAISQLVNSDIAKISATVRSNDLYDESGRRGAQVKREDVST